MSSPAAKSDPELSAFFKSIRPDISDEALTYLLTHPELKPIFSEYLAKVILMRPTSLFDFTKFHFKYLEKPKPDAKPLVITAPSGCGKGTLITRLMKEFPLIFAQSCSHTTRLPRAGEVSGFKYFFTTKEKFEENIAKNGFLEYVKYNDNYYGTAKQTIQDVIASGRICIVEIEIKGAKNVHGSGMDCNFFFMLPPSVDALVARLKGRGTETDDVIEKRVNIAKEELAEAEKVNFFTKMVNDDFEKFYQEFLKYLKKTYPSFDFSRPILVPKEVEAKKEAK